MHTRRDAEPSEQSVRLQVLGLCRSYLLVCFFAFFEYTTNVKKHKINMENYSSHRHQHREKKKKKSPESKALLVLNASQQRRIGQPLPRGVLGKPFHHGTAKGSQQQTPRAALGLETGQLLPPET